MRSGVRRQLEQAAGTNVRLSFSAEGGGWSAACEFARHGLGVAILPAASLNRMQDRFVCRTLDRRFQLKHVLIHRARKPIPAEYPLLAKALRRKTRQNGTPGEGQTPLSTD